MLEINRSFLLLLPRKIEVLIGDVRLKVTGKEISCWDCAVPDLCFAMNCL